MTVLRYSPFAKTLHWLIAGLLVVQFVLAELADDAATESLELARLANHRSVGITILLLALVRLVWRSVQSPPPLPAATPRWQVVGAAISHWSMYGLLFALPITGWLMTSAENDPVSWFGLVTLPDFVAPNESLAEALEEIHETLAWLLAGIASLHLVAALKHALINRDGVFSRMTSIPMLAVFALVIAIGIALLA